MRDRARDFRLPIPRAALLLARSSLSLWTRKERDCVQSMGTLTVVPSRHAPIGFDIDSFGKKMFRLPMQIVQMWVRHTQSSYCFHDFSRVNVYNNQVHLEVHKYCNTFSGVMASTSPLNVLPLLSAAFQRHYTRVFSKGIWLQSQRRS